MVKISIIIPVYKVEKYLSRCLDSVLSQTYTDFEVILIDDCSPDSSGAICDEYAKKDKRIKVIHREKNGGASAARNLGLETCKGKYISFVDSDDYIVPEYLGTLVNVLESNQADVAQCGFYHVVNEVVEKNEQVTFQENYTKEQAYGLLYGDGRNDVLNFLLWNKLFKKEKIQNLRFVEGLRCEDVIFISEVVMAVDKVVYKAIPLYYYCRHDDSVMGIMQQDKRDMISSHILAYREVAISAENASLYVQTLSNARLAIFYVSAIKNKMLKGNQQLKTMFKEDKKRFAFLKNKRIPLIKRIVLAIGG